MAGFHYGKLTLWQACIMVGLHNTIYDDLRWDCGMMFISFWDGSGGHFGINLSVVWGEFSVSLG